MPPPRGRTCDRGGGRGGGNRRTAGHGKACRAADGRRGAARLRGAHAPAGSRPAARSGRGAVSRARLRALRHRPEDRGRRLPRHLAARAAIHHRARMVWRDGRAGRYNLCERVREPGFKLYGHTAPGALAEYAVRPAIALHKVPSQVSDVAAALVNQGALTVHAARRARLEPGSSVAVFGPGLLGLLMLQVARAAGATQIITVGRGKRLVTARELGSTEVVDYSAADPVSAVRGAAGGRGVDYVFDCSGNPAVLAQGMRAARRGGTVPVLGLAGGRAAGRRGDPPGAH